MKLKTSLAAAAAFLTLAPAVVAQETTTQTEKKTTTSPDGTVTTESTTVSTGNIQALTPDTLSVTTATAKTPEKYTFTAETRYENEAGKTVSVEQLEAGVPVTVHWAREGDRLVARRVILLQPGATGTTKTTASTTETTVMPGPPPLEGTLYRLQPNAVMVTTKNAETPITLVRSSQTQVVDLDGKAIPPDIIRTDLPVSVYYGEDGTTLRAVKVLVKRHQTRLPDGKLTLTATAPIVIERTETVREEKQTTTPAPRE